jgi:hypothetical protein
MRFPGMLLVLLALTLGATAPALARAPRSIVAGPPLVEGSPNVLPYTPGEPPPVLVAAARALPAAQLAMQQLAGAGFVRQEASDLARTSDGRAVVMLGFSDPALPQRAAVVAVMTDPANARTAVDFGVFDVDPATGTIRFAFDSPEAANGLITAMSPASTAPENYVVTTGKGARAFMKWLECAVSGCAAGGAACATVGVLLGPVGPPALAGCVIATCAVASYACVW